MIQNSNYSSLRKTPTAKENTSQKASSSQNLNSKCSASHANGAKAAIIKPQNYFGYSSLLKTPTAKENTFQKASSSQNLNSKCFANHANEAKAPIVKMHNSYPMLNHQGKVNLYQSRGLKLNSSSSVASSKTSGAYGKNYCICAIACVAKVPYSVACEAALKYGEFTETGMYYTLEGAMKTLKDFGISYTYHPVQPKKWADFPDKAIVIYYNHVVVFSRENGRDKVYERDKVFDDLRPDSYYPPSYFSPDPEHGYIEIH